MKSFLLKNNTPTIKWGLLQDEIYFEGIIPEGYDLAVTPSGSYVILDVDNKNGKCGFNHIPSNIYFELKETFYYKTRSGGAHYWIKYTGNRSLINKATSLGLDLRTSKGYVKYVWTKDIRECVKYIKESSPRLNEWLEELFSNNKVKIKEENADR